MAKLIYRMGGDAIAVVGMRMAMALPLFLLMAWWANRGQARDPISAHTRWKIVGLGVTGYYLASTLDFMGLQYISASLERAILYLNPTMVLLLSALWFRRRIQGMQLASMALAYAGVVVVWLHDWDAAAMVSVQASGVGAMTPVQTITIGSLLVLGSALSYAIYLMGSGAMVQQHGSLWLVSRASCVACVLCLVQWGVGLVARGAFLLALPVWLVMRGVQLLGATMASQVGMVGPLSTIWLAAWTLSEPITPRLLLGTGAILGGILLLTRTRREA